MRQTIKILVGVLCLLFSTEHLAAQTLGAKLGLNISGIEARNKNGKTFSQSNVIPGFHVGMSFDYPFKINKLPDLLFAAEAGFLIESKGYSFDAAIITTTQRTSTTLYYLDFPLHVRIGYDLDAVKIYAITGFWVGVGLYGEIVSTNINNSSSLVSKRNIKWGADANNHDFNALDFGLDFGAGVELNSIPLRFELVFNFGLANIASYKQNSNYWANRTFAISAGYRFLDFSK